MRRLLLALLLGLLATPSYAGDLFYQESGGPLLSVPDTGGSPSQVFSSSETYCSILNVVSRYNHAVSNGQVLVQGYKRLAGGTYSPADVYLSFRAADQTVVTRQVTNLSATTLPPSSSFVKLGQDDSFFSFLAKDGAGRVTLWRLNVTVDQALDPGYVPPTTYDDPRLQVILDYTSPFGQNSCYTWSPDGARVAYIHHWKNTQGTEMLSVRVKNLVVGYSTLPDGDVRLADSVIPGATWHGSLQWSPINDQIVNSDQTGGIWMVYANNPGVLNWVVQTRTYKYQGLQYTEKATFPKWTHDGSALAVDFYQSHVFKTQTFTDHYPALLSGGWFAKALTTVSYGASDVFPIGWTP